MNKIFLLGGLDLEMIEIRKLLESKGMHYEDRHLSWGNAQLSAYEDVLNASPDAEFYGVELQEDCPLPSRYVRIDHHNDFASHPAAVLQVAELLGVKPDRHLLLVAANDAGYIPAMEKLGANRKEIDEIRRLDRQCQGVTPYDEALALQSLKENLRSSDGILIVKSLASHFSPICDTLYPYKRLLIYTDAEWVFYGEGKQNLVEAFKLDIDNNRVYHGGGDCGYIGSVKNVFTTEKIQSFIESIPIIAMVRKPYSSHIFMFPFRWSVKGQENCLFSEQIDLNKIPYTEPLSNWERVREPSEADDLDVLYNEGNYFYEFVHSALYDDKPATSLVRHFERCETRHPGVTYTIVCGDKEKPSEYKLDVDAINLNLYSSGVGVLTFYMHNNRYADKADVFAINQYGRRVFPPFIADVKNRYEIAHSLRLDGLNVPEGHYSENFNEWTNDSSNCNKPASFIEKMIKEVTGEIEIQSVVDDRMFVLCWYKNDFWSDGFKNDYENFIDNDEDWYKFVFVDAKYPTCQNDAMRRKLLKDATYERWQKLSSLYGITRYSMVYLTNSECPSHLTSCFETMYARMVELVLVQRASVLRFSSEVARISHKNITGKNLAKQVSSLYKEYIHFENKMYFREISAQDQCIEIYHKLLDAMDIKEQVEKLDDEIGELYNYASLCEDRLTNNTMLFFTSLTIFSVIAGIFSMTQIKSYPFFFCELAIVAFIGGLVCLFYSIISKR